ncbi:MULTISPECIES: hypothetical protein [unclassified Actinoplanes]|uniref:hypothetical protein n=1 Tax=unclassified Actinoplanes TaxID=2626549 RepID=UPI0005BD14C3|nr:MULTISPECIES: hypothetical protein [unclassified Actinoplanes]
METKSEKDVNSAVQQHADNITKVAAKPLEDPKMRSGPCTDPMGRDSDTVYTVQGVYNLAPPATGTHLDILAKVRTDWTSKGYTITDDRTVAADRGVLAAKTKDGYNLDIETATPDGFAIIIHSPCFERPD